MREGVRGARGLAAFPNDEVGGAVDVKGSFFMEGKVVVEDVDESWISTDFTKTT